jgi:hypothetical protein
MQHKAYSWWGKEGQSHMNDLNWWLSEGWLVDGKSVRMIRKPGTTDFIYFYCTLYKMKAGE